MDDIVLSCVARAGNSDSSFAADTFGVYESQRTVEHMSELRIWHIPQEKEDHDHMNEVVRIGQHWNPDQPCLLQS